MSSEDYRKAQTATQVAKEACRDAIRRAREARLAGGCEACGSKRDHRDPAHCCHPAIAVGVDPASDGSTEIVTACALCGRVEPQTPDGQTAIL